MRILSGYHFADSGKVSINNIPIEDNNIDFKNYVGYLPENVPLYTDMTPREYLVFSAELRGIPKNDTERMIEKALLQCGLKNRADQRIETLSRGYKQRVGLAQAILHDPPVLILDEPATGLDPNQIIEIRNLIKELGKEKTVIFSTHILKEVESVCTHFIILNQGSIVFCGNISKDINLEELFVSLTAGKREI
jgi:ABC-2 type transport system ATP-binding protein